MSRICRLRFTGVVYGSRSMYLDMHLACRNRLLGTDRFPSRENTVCISIVKNALFFVQMDCLLSVMRNPHVSARSLKVVSPSQENRKAHDFEGGCSCCSCGAPFFLFTLLLSPFDNDHAACLSPLDKSSAAYGPFKRTPRKRMPGAKDSSASTFSRMTSRPLWELTR